MKITAVSGRLIPPRWSLVKIETDEGLVGWGEPTLEGHARTALSAVDEMSRLLIGENPLRIEHLWQALYRGSFYRGGPILCSAISGIEQALWDIAGKFYNTPVYNLLGGPCRDRIRVYHGVGAGTPEEAAARAKAAQAAGMTALKTGMTPGATRLIDTKQVVDQTVARIGAMREAVGAEMDIAIDCHGRLSPAMAIRLCDAVAEFVPMFVEEPVLPENTDALVKVARAVNVPLATGERLFTKFGFRPVLEANAVAVVQPDLSHAGGILETKKIAAMAEAYYVGLAPHCPLGPLALAASAQTAACCPNFVIQEHIPQALGAGYLRQPLVVKDGYLELPTGPGLGVEVDEEAVEAMELHDWCTPALRHADDQSVADW